MFMVASPNAIGHGPSHKESQEIKMEDFQEMKVAVFGIEPTVLVLVFLGLNVPPV
jgi:hypothetical protein